ncbi:MAG: outer membrane protein assembly factor BamD, partial [Planctomycetota bacterium]
MRTHRTLLSLTLLGLFSCSSAPPEPLAEADLSEVRALVDQGEWNKAWSELNGLDREDFDRLSQGSFSLLAGDVAYKIGAYDKAIKHYEEFLLFEGPSVDTQRVVERLFEMGVALLQGDEKVLGLFTDKSRGVTTLHNLAAWAPFSPLAAEALARVGEYHYTSRMLNEAAEDYSLILRNHPHSEWADLATYRLAMCRYLQIDGPEIDGQLILSALDQLKHYLDQFPSGLYRREAQETKQHLEELAAGHELDVGDYYREIDNIPGARFHYEKARKW